MNAEGRLGRVTALEYLEGLATADTARIRAMRDECRAEERRLSYVRRVLQGHVDLAAAEATRRGGGEQSPLVARVARALTGPAGAPRSARAVGLYEPSGGGDDALLADVQTIDLLDLDEAELHALLARLGQRERAVSDQRAVLLDHLDRLQDALVARYRQDRVAAEQVAIARDTR